jgi:GDP-L-fucose synthase
MDKSDKIYVAGHSGLVGSAITRLLIKNGYDNLILKKHAELNLVNQNEVSSFFKNKSPEYVFLTAAKVGGIFANNSYPAEFIYQNLMIQTNIINSSFENHVKKLLFLGSSCIYPKDAPQPLKEDYLLSGLPEKTNEAYAISKIAGLKMTEYYRKQYQVNFISAMPTNLYGPGDNYDLQTSHVLPALMRKFHEAKINRKSYVEVWGTGKPKREFLYVNDCAEACLFLMKNYNETEFVNVGSGEEISIMDLALLIKQIVGFSGEIHFNPQKPDGTPRKLLDVSKINSLGWKATTPLREGIKNTYQDYLEKYK